MQESNGRKRLHHYVTNEHGHGMCPQQVITSSSQRPSVYECLETPGSDLLCHAAPMPNMRCCLLLPSVNYKTLIALLSYRCSLEFDIAEFMFIKHNVHCIIDEVQCFCGYYIAIRSWIYDSNSTRLFQIKSMVNKVVLG